MTTERDDKTDTPRTDLMQKEAGFLAPRTGSEVAWKFARELERELVTARAAANTWKEENTRLRVGSAVRRTNNEGPQINAALNTWFASDQGERCLAGPVTGKYLKNRLEAAFIEGWDASAALTPSAKTFYTRDEINEL